MADVLEVCPGVAISPDGVFICPGCGCEALGLDARDPQVVLDWSKGAFAALKDLGVQGCSQEEAENFARQYLTEPWHDGE